MATRVFLADAIAAWRAAGNGNVHIDSVAGAEAYRRVEVGDALDLVVVAADSIARLAAAGRLVPGSERPLANSSAAIAVKLGAPRPDISTQAALRAALLAARTIGYSTGPSGVALLKMFGSWDIADEITSRLVQAPSGVPVGDLLARGDVEIGFQQLSELVTVAGIDVVGGMPPGLEIDTIFTGAVVAGSVRAEGAQAFLDFARSPAMDEARRRQGLQNAG